VRPFSEFARFGLAAGHVCSIHFCAALPFSNATACSKAFTSSIRSNLGTARTPCRPRRKPAPTFPFQRCALPLHGVSTHALTSQLLQPAVEEHYNAYDDPTMVHYSAKNRKKRKGKKEEL
jgi:hypothetical protein